ncbi:YdaE family protein [Siccibacter colletis]|uniref:YdaE family protein n=1 Tax=Siccibacter colletis TaxID=1505757 RepID=UPI0022A9F66D|nr:YdaE family protein [Siccibacter colletis]
MCDSKKCAYHLCGKPIEKSEEVKNELTLIRGAQLTHEERDYCSVRCASYDQMAHEA